MSRRNRDYSGTYPGRYHHSEEPFWVKAVAGVVATVVMTGVGLVAERIGDSWHNRNDKEAYETEGDKTRARTYGMTVLEQRAGLLIDLSDIGTVHDVPKPEDEDLRSQFHTLANASLPGGQPANQLSYLAHAYDLEWNGSAGKRNRAAPDEHCVRPVIPANTDAVIVWQNSDVRATAAIEQQGQELVLELCHYGKDTTPDHHKVAAFALGPGHR